MFGRVSILVFIGVWAAGPTSARPASHAMPPPPIVAIDVSILAGDGRVTSVPEGIDCPTTCTASFVLGSTVTLTAAPGDGATLYGWGGACSGEKLVCNLTPPADTSVSATFDPARLTVTAAGPGGWVTSSGVASPEGIDCGVGSTCSATFAVGTEVTLFGIRSPVAALDDWVGCLNTDGSVCNITLTTDLAILAKFSTAALAGPVNVETDVDLTPAGAGAGSIQIVPPGVDCATSCKKRYPVGVMLRFVAVPDSESTFGGWGGACAGATGTTCRLGVVAGLTIAATFDRKQTIAGGGGGGGGGGSGGGGGAGGGRTGDNGDPQDSEGTAKAGRIATRVTARAVRGRRGRRIEIVVSATRRAHAAIRIAGPRATTLRRSAAIHRGRNVISIGIGPRRPGGRHRIRIVLRDASGFAQTILRTVSLR